MATCKENDPICVFSTTDERASDAARLESIIDDEFEDLKVMVISVVGKPGQGKSLLLNFLLSYLRNKGESRWLQDPVGGSGGSSSRGFLWKHSRKPVTMGILVWPELFKVENVDGDDIAVILVDTQGVFGTDSTTKDDTMIFSLSLLLSSVQIFNIKQNFSGDDFSYLHLSIELSRLVTGCSPGHKPFQDLIFLIRDWSYPTENSYGWDGGAKVLSEELRKKSTVRELDAARASVKNCFDSVRCFLMPHPGEKVDSSPDFNGDLSDMKPAFVQHMQAFVADLLSPENLRVKKLHGRELTVRELGDYLYTIAADLRDDEFPAPSTLYFATVSATNSGVVNDCYEKYVKRMTELVAGGSEHFEDQQAMISNEILNMFEESLKMGNEELIEEATAELKRRIGASKAIFKLANRAVDDETKLEAFVSELETKVAAAEREGQELGRAITRVEKRLDAAIRRSREQSSCGIS